MKERYDLTREKGRKVFHGKYALYRYHKEVGLFTTAFDGGAIRLIVLECPIGSADSTVTVFFDDGQISERKTKCISSYVFQFGVAASSAGERILIQIRDPFAPSGKFTIFNKFPSLGGFFLVIS